ncbi:hypothetical protein [Streptomyces sp. NPDC058613]|uniref:hypothetical protein n=1 Tax=unclassified Streptomyces TaxID=2593676 RepID=UPI00365ED987
MTFEARDLNLTDPTKGFMHFVLYSEARLGVATLSWNAELRIEPQQTTTPRLQEWRSRLVRCEPNAMHCMLVERSRIPALFHPCVTEDASSPSASGGVGCMCRRTFYDPEFGLPIVGEHFKQRQEGGTDQWTYQTFAPLGLRPEDAFSRLYISRHLFWGRTENGSLSILPQREGRGYSVGYNGGGPAALAAYLTQLADSGGQKTAAGASYEQAHPAILAWTQSSAADRGTTELSVGDLQAMQRS